MAGAGGGGWGSFERLWLVATSKRTPCPASTCSLSDSTDVLCICVVYSFMYFVRCLPFLRSPGNWEGGHAMTSAGIRVSGFGGGVGGFRLPTTRPGRAWRWEWKGPERRGSSAV